MRILLIPLSLLFLLSIGCGPKHYTATATIQILRDDPSAMGNPEVTQQRERERMQSSISILESANLVEQVEKILAASDKTKAFLAPYSHDLSDHSTIEILNKHRSIHLYEMSLLIGVSYAHPDPEIAALVANTFAEAFIDYQKTLDLHSSMKVIEDIRVRAEQQQLRIEALKVTLSKMAEQGDTDSATYQDLLRDLEVQQKFHKALLSRSRQETTSIRLLVPSARIIDRAIAPTR